MLEAFRVQYGGRPFLLTVGMLCIISLVRAAGSRDSSRRAWTPVHSALILSASATVLVAYGIIVTWYASDPHYFDNAEPMMTAVGWLFNVGRPIYTAVDAAERYSHIYGPVAFIAQGLVLRWLGPSIVVSKWLGAASAFASLAVLFLVLRRSTSARRSIGLVALVALWLLGFRQYSFWTRPEPLELVSVALAWWFAVSFRGASAALGVGVASGLLWNLKLTGSLYSLPIFVALWYRSGRRQTTLALVIAAATGTAPFLVFGNVAFENYVAWLGFSARIGLLPGTLSQNVEWASYFLLPVLLSFYAGSRESRPQDAEWRGTLAAFLLAMALVAVAAAKPGAGPYHLMPFLPTIAVLIASHLRGLTVPDIRGPIVHDGTTALVLTALLVALAQQARLITVMVPRRGLHEIEDITRFADSHDGVIEMGYGATDGLTLERPVLVFRNGSYLLDQPAIQEYQLQRVAFPQATLDAVSSCRVNFWLIPKGEEPFSARNTYAAVKFAPIFSDAFRARFKTTHRLVSNTDYYDVWQCTPPGPS